MTVVNESWLNDAAVDEFGAAMKAKLRKVRVEKERGGWYDSTCSVEDLERELIKHVGKGDMVDVANLAMMIYLREADV